MVSEITPDNLHLFAYTNFDLCKKVRGVVMFFHGLGETSHISQPDSEASFYGAQDLLYVIPFYGPWAWMNDSAVKVIDRIIDVVFEKYGLNADTPIVSSGMSMGGLGALTFPRFSAHADRITAIAANCPVCDLIHLRDTRADIPKTTYYAFKHYALDMDSAVKTVSPIHNLDTAARVPYFIVHCDADTAVPKAEHSDIFVPELKKRGYDVTYVSVPEREHVDLDENGLAQYRAFISKYAAGR